METISCVVSVCVNMDGYQGRSRGAEVSEFFGHYGCARIIVRLVGVTGLALRYVELMVWEMGEMSRDNE